MGCLALCSMRGFVAVVAPQFPQVVTPSRDLHWGEAGEETRVRGGHIPTAPFLGYWEPTTQGSLYSFEVLCAAWYKG